MSAEHDSTEGAFRGGETVSRVSRILVVDDDELALETLVELLSMTGYSVETATEGRAGVEIFRNELSDLVITDIRMPHVDGLEMLLQVREIDDIVPVIVVTGHGDLDNAIGALRKGAYDFLQKPINPDILLSTVRQGLEHCRLKRFEKEYRRLLEEQVEDRTRELQRTNEFITGILDSSTGVSIVLTDFDRNVLFWNTGAQNMFGYSAEEMIGTSVRRLYPDDELSDHIEELIKHLPGDDHRTVQGIVEEVAKDGRRLTVSLTLSPMFDSSGKVRGILGLGQDVTEEVRLNKELLKSYQRIQRIQASSVFALAKLAGSRDGEITGHLKRLQEYSRVLCTHLRSREKYASIMTDQFIEDLVQSSVLHDIGKVGMPDSVLFTSRKFRLAEREIMKEHTEIGGKALEEAVREAGEGSFLSLGKEVAYSHHERWDGQGYPQGFKGEEIPLSARIVAIADVYDALTTRRRYKEAYPHDQACSIMTELSGSQFDPSLIEVFTEVQDKFREIRQKYSSEADPFPG